MFSKFFLLLIFYTYKGFVINQKFIEIILFMTKFFNLIFFCKIHGVFFRLVYINIKLNFIRIFYYISVYIFFY